MPAFLVCHCNHCTSVSWVFVIVKIFPSFNPFFCRDIRVGENNGVCEHDDSEVQLGEAERGTIGWGCTHTSCAFFVFDKNKKLEMCSFIVFSVLSQGKMKVIASVFLCFWGVGQLREKGCECEWEERCEHNDFNAKISKEKSSKKLSGWNYPGMGFLVKLWYIRCGLSALRRSIIDVNYSTIRTMFVLYQMLSALLFTDKNQMVNEKSSFI